MFSDLTSSLLLLATAAAANAALSFSGASWIWGGDARSPPTGLPAENVAFRKDIFTNACTPPTSIEIIATADDAYTLFVNGKVVAAAAGSRDTPQYVCVVTNPGDFQTAYNNRVVIAALANNTHANSVAGLLATVKLNFVGGGSEQFVTDSSWLTDLDVPTGFQDPNFNDSAWTDAVAQETYGGPTWGSIPAPTNQTCAICQANTFILF